MKTLNTGVKVTEKKGKLLVESPYDDDLMYQNVTLDTEYEEAIKQQYINLLKRL